MLLLDNKKVAKQGPKPQYEYESFITDYLLPEIMISYYYIDNHFCKAGCINSKFNWLVI